MLNEATLINRENRKRNAATKLGNALSDVYLAARVLLTESACKALKDMLPDVSTYEEKMYVDINGYNVMGRVVVAVDKEARDRNVLAVCDYLVNGAHDIGIDSERSDLFRRLMMLYCKVHMAKASDNLLTMEQVLHECDNTLDYGRRLFWG